MTLNKELSTAIEHYADEHISEWINQYWGKRIVNEQEIREKILRVEESFECQSALSKQGFEEVDKRFDLVVKQSSRFYKFFISFLLVIFGAILALAAPLWPGG